MQYQITTDTSKKKSLEVEKKKQSVAGQAWYFTSPPSKVSFSISGCVFRSIRGPWSHDRSESSSVALPLLSSDTQPEGNSSTQWSSPHTRCPAGTDTWHQAAPVHSSQWLISPSHSPGSCTSPWSRLSWQRWTLVIKASTDIRQSGGLNSGPSSMAPELPGYLWAQEQLVGEVDGLKALTQSN